MHPHHRWRASCHLTLAFLAAWVVAASAATGALEGTIRFADGAPASWAHVLIPELRRGTLTDELGRWQFADLPPGRWAISVRALGHEPLSDTVLVRAGERLRFDRRLGESRPVRSLTTTTVEAQRTDVGSSDSRQRIGRDAIEVYRPSGLTELLALKPGVVAAADGMHVRGGRRDEVKMRVNDVEVTDPLTASNASVPLASVAEAAVLTGGLDAEHGNALSGIVEVRTREGGPRFEGQLRWDTDRFGAPERTYDDLDRIALSAGGPLGWRGLTWFSSLEGTFSNTSLASGMSRRTRTVLDFVQLGNRQDNQVRTSTKLAWVAGPRDKWSVDWLLSRTLTTPYDHMWSRRGWVQVLRDTVSGPGGVTIVPRYGRWSATREDETFEWQNLADRVPTTDDRFEQWVLTWVRQLGSTGAWTTRLSQVSFDTHASVGGREPWEYDTASPYFWSGNQGPGTEDNPYFATHGDFPFWERRSARMIALKSDVAARRWAGHRSKAGVELRTTHVRNLSLVAPNGESFGLPGGNRSDYANTYPEGGAYVQDRWEFEGLVLNAGLRADAFSPGRAVPDRDLPSGRRWKWQVSPRLGVAHPISDRDALSFHYGWTYQTPTRSYLFENRDPLSTVPVRGNPDLEPQTNVEYQASVQHLFTREISGTFSLFYRDIFGLITVRRERDGEGNLISRYVNNDYASVRGAEASLSRDFSHHFAGELNYTFALATGVASDPLSALQFYNGGRLYLPIGERALEWDQRHTVSLRVVMREPGAWGMTVGWNWASGRPFTPTWTNDRRADPRLTNAKRLPAIATVDWNGDRNVRLWGMPLTLFLDVGNVFDTRNLTRLAPGGAGNPLVDLEGISDYLAYYTETGRAGGAYRRDVDGDRRLDWVPLNDPRVFDPGRNVRVGASLHF